jgi:hypothetical protein
VKGGRSVYRQRETAGGPRLARAAHLCMLQDACCRTPAAGRLLQDACCRTPAAGRLLQDACCRTHNGQGLEVLLLRSDSAGPSRPAVRGWQAAWCGGHAACRWWRPGGVAVAAGGGAAPPCCCARQLAAGALAPACPAGGPRLRLR